MSQTTGPVAASPAKQGLAARLLGVITSPRESFPTVGANMRLPMIGNTFVGCLLGGVDLFVIGRVFVLAIGLAVLDRRRTQPIATALLAVYAVIVVGLAAVMSRGGGA